jgi:hypothetical protein
MVASLTNESGSEDDTTAPSKQPVRLPERALGVNRRIGGERRGSALLNRKGLHYRLEKH